MRDGLSLLYSIMISFVILATILVVRYPVEHPPTQEPECTCDLCFEGGY